MRAHIDEGSKMVNADGARSPRLDVMHTRLTEGAYVVTVVGDLDCYTEAGFRDALRSVLALGALELVVDLSDVASFDSTALGVLLLVLRRLRGTGGDLVVVCKSPQILRLFEVTGLDRAFPIEGSLGAALQRVIAPESQAG